jgi:23S rRNA (uracil1939-C5)-methyltransferase
MDRVETKRTREVEIEKWVYGGDALARDEGQVLLAPFALPGERVRLETVRERAGVVEARVAEVLQPAPERIAARCAVFGRCGGCHYQNADYPYQLARKVEILREVLQRVGKFDAPEEIETVAGEPWGYRNRSQFHCGPGGIGYLAAGSHELVAVEECPISAPAINAALKALRGMRRERAWPRFLRELELFTNGQQTMINALETEGRRGLARGFFNWAAERIPGANEGALDVEAAGFRFQVSHGSFFQVNRFLADALVERALRRAEGRRAVDLYAGVGLFTLPLAKKFERVDAVELTKSALNDLQENTARAGVPVHIEAGMAEDYLDKLEKGPDFVLADPPRRGLGARAVKRLAELKPPRLTIVSCDPATLARDLVGLHEGGYKVAALTLVDLFPQTFHLETVADLELG